MDAFCQERIQHFHPNCCPKVVFAAFGGRVGRSSSSYAGKAKRGGKVGRASRLPCFQTWLAAAIRGGDSRRRFAAAIRGGDSRRGFAAAIRGGDSRRRFATAGCSPRKTG